MSLRAAKNKAGFSVEQREFGMAVNKQPGIWQNSAT
jgi:hypothetical protein